MQNLSDAIVDCAESLAGQPLPASEVVNTLERAAKAFALECLENFSGELREKGLDVSKSVLDFADQFYRVESEV